MIFENYKEGNVSRQRSVHSNVSQFTPVYLIKNVGVGRMYRYAYVSVVYFTKKRRG